MASSFIRCGFLIKCNCLIKNLFRAKTLVENTGFISGSDDACGGLVFGCFHESKELAAAGAAHGGTKHNQSLYGYQQIVQKIYDQSVFLHLHLLFCRSSLFSFDNQRIHLNPKMILKGSIPKM